MVAESKPVISRKTTWSAATFVLLALVLSPNTLLAQGRVYWQPGGVPVKDSTLTGDLAMVPDQRGGALIVWGDERHPDENALYVQRLDSSGTLMWPDTGIRAMAQSSLEFDAVAASDDRGGVAFCWIERHGPEPVRICAQRVDSGGTRLWGDIGLTVVEQPPWGRIDYLAMCEDGSGGAVIGWYLKRLDDTVRLVVQRVDSLGRLMWEPQGVELCRNPKVWWGQLVCLGDSGTCAVWLTQQDDIWAQRIGRDGVVMWQPGGVPVCVDPYKQMVPSACSVAEGVVVSWSDDRNEDSDVYAQKLDYRGNALWTENGVPVCAMPGNQGGVNWRHQDMLRSVGHICGDVAFAWYDRREGSTRLYCQRLNGAGEQMWDTAGVEVGAVATNDTMIDIYKFGFTGADANSIIVSWFRYLGLRAWELRAQKLDSTGRLCWGEGLIIRRDSVPRICVVTDETGGAIGCWLDLRYAWPNHSLYAQRYGDVPSSVTGSKVETPSVRLLVHPNPACGCLRIRFVVPPDKPASLAVYDICGRKVRMLWDRQGPANQQVSIHWDRTADDGQIVPAGVYSMRLVAGSTILTSTIVVLTSSVEGG